MNKAGCAIALLAVVVLGGGALYYVLSALSAFQWFFSSGAAPTGWVEGFVTVVVVLVFAIGFLAIMLVPDGDERSPNDDKPSSN